MAGGAYYHWVYQPAHRKALAIAYVLSPSLDVLNTTAEVHTVLDVLKTDDRVEVLKRTDNWAEVRLPDGTVGWVLGNQLMDSAVHDAGEELLRRVLGEQVQAEGHTSDMVNLRIKPSRRADQLSVLAPDAKLQVFGRRLVERTEAAPNANGAGQPKLEAWYLVRCKTRAGWVLGRLVTLDIPPDIAQYAESYNLVAWFVLTTVLDHGRKVPEYLVADRVGAADEDFNHIRAFTWSPRYHHYATAFVEGGLDGTFPIRIEDINNLPYFRLRLEDKDGRKFQKIYGLFDTIVRPVGTVEGWESDAMPAPTVGQRRRRKR